jgi:hypothetical protein
MIETGGAVGPQGSQTGRIRIRSADAIGAVRSGDVELGSGAASAGSGNVLVTAGSASSGEGGSATLRAGASDRSTGGAAVVVAGNGADGGNVLLSVRAATVPSAAEAA